MRSIHLLALLLFTLLIAVQPLHSKAQNKAVSDPAAVALLEKVSKKFRSYSAVKGKYTLIIDNPEMDLNEEQKGNFYIKGEMFKLETGGQEIICNNESIWIHLKDEKEVQINDYEPDENTITPTQIFTIYEQEFLSHLGAARRVGDKMLEVVELTPLDKSKPYFKIKVFVDPATHHIQSAKVFDKSGSRFEYRIDQFTVNPKLTDDFFTFKPADHPGVEVIDLR